MNGTMKAIRFHRYGDANELRYEDAPLPEVGPDDILIKVHSAGVNPADWQFRQGCYKDFAPLPLPFILGWDVAGTVHAVGAQVTRFRAGDAVFAMADMSRNGAYAEYVAVRAEHTAPAPKSIPLERASAVPLAALTAWAALFDTANLKAGQSVLVHAGAGGVGMFAIQLAAWAGARIYATASAVNHELLRRLGASHVIDYRSEDFSNVAKNIDVVVDTVGGETRERSWSVLRKGGMLACVAMPPPNEAQASRYGVRAAMVAVAPHGARLVEIGHLVDTGRLQVVIDREFPLAEAAAAHVCSRGRHARGKIVLRVG